MIARAQSLRYFMAHETTEAKSCASTLTRLSISWLKAVNRRCAFSEWNKMRSVARPPSLPNDEPQKSESEKLFNGKSSVCVRNGIGTHTRKNLDALAKIFRHRRWLLLAPQTKRQSACDKITQISSGRENTHPDKARIKDKARFASS